MLDSILRWVTIWYFTRQLRQGPHHYENLRDLFVLIRLAWAEEFYADTPTVQDGDLYEAFVYSGIMYEQHRKEQSNDA
ncbi:MAG: hypothetical protein KJP02_05665 [Octadecabacter sp.]|nr:hypothetical protein [Octadecabacter sp.]